MYCPVQHHTSHITHHTYESVGRHLFCMPPSYGLPFSLLSVPANFHIFKWYDICESCALFALPCLPFRFGARAKDRARYVSYPTGLETSTLRMIILCHAIMPCSASARRILQSHRIIKSSFPSLPFFPFLPSLPSFPSFPYPLLDTPLITQENYGKK